MKTIIKLDRFFAWILFGGMLLYFISGYGMTKGIIDASLAGKIHLDILTYIILIAFTAHTSFAIHLAFKRWGFWGYGGKFILVAFFIIFFGSFVYVDHYYKPVKNSSVKESSSKISNENEDDNSKVSEDTSETAVETPVSSPDNSVGSGSQTQQKSFTLTELATYDGQNGKSAYVAVDGNVYDLTSVFADGNHFSHLAGTELTNAFYSRHAKSSLSKYPIVGTLVK